MPFTVEVAYRDGSIETVAQEFAELREAAGFAVRLADDLGRTVTRYTRGPGLATGVAIRHDAATVWSIRVFAGGLSPEPAQEGIIFPLLSRSDDPAR